MATAPEAAFYARATGDAALVALLSSGIEYGWPKDTIQKGDFPRITFLLASGVPVRSAWKNGRLQVDTWVWPHVDADATTGWTRLSAIDERLEVLFHEQQWVDEDGVRFYARCDPSRDWPSAPNSAMRRTRTITVSRLTGVSE